MANKQLNAIITIGGTVTGALKGALGTTQTKLRAIGGTIRDLEREQKRLQNTIKNSGDMGAPIYHLENRYESLTRQIEKARREQDRMKRATATMDAGKSKMGSAAATVGAVGAVVATAGIPIVHAARFETAMLPVAKQIEGARDESGRLTEVYYDMVKQVQLLGREIPIATNEIAGMVAAGARMGVAKDELIQFTKTSAMMASAFELPADELADNMGKIAGLYKIPIPAIGTLADAVNYLDDNAISKGGDIIDFLTRTGGSAASAKIAGQEMAALGSTLLTLGERSETASTATNSMFSKLAAADKGTKKFRGALDELGLSAEGIKQGMQMDAQGTILSVMEAVNKLPAADRLGVLVDMFGLEHADTMAKLAGGLGEYRRQIEMVNSEGAKGSMAREFAAAAETTNAQWQIAKNKMTEASVNIGSVLLPVVNSALNVVGGFATGVAEFARACPWLIKTVATVVGTVGGLVLAFNAAKFAIGGVQFVFGALKLMMATNPIGLAFVAIATAAVLIYQNWEPISAFFSGIWEGIKAGASTAWDFIKSAFLNGTPLGLVVKHWEPISKFFSGLWDGIKTLAGNAIDSVLRKISAVGDAWRATKEFFGGEAGPRANTPAPRNLPKPPPLAANWGRGGSNTDNRQYSIVVKPHPGQNPREIATQTMRQIRESERSQRGSMLYDSAEG